MQRGFVAAHHVLQACRVEPECRQLAIELLRRRKDLAVAAGMRGRSEREIEAHHGQLAAHDPRHQAPCGAQQHLLQEDRRRGGRLGEAHHHAGEVGPAHQLQHHIVLQQAKGARRTAKRHLQRGRAEGRARDQRKAPAPKRAAQQPDEVVVQALGQHAEQPRVLLRRHARVRLPEQAGRDAGLDQERLERLAARTPPGQDAVHEADGNRLGRMKHRRRAASRGCCRADCAPARACHASAAWPDRAPRRLRCSAIRTTQNGIVPRAIGS
ncbi:hypothetical protein D3C87_1437820 [compost metagenome]